MFKNLTHQRLISYHSKKYKIMKILFNQTQKINNNYQQLSNIVSQRQPNSNYEQSELPSVTSAYLSTLPNVSFGKRPDMEFLLGFADRFKCAYTGKPMISKAKANELYQKLEKRPNAQAAINLLQHMQGYMHDIESIVFDILKDASHKSKRDFQDILVELMPKSLERLKAKQLEVLNSANKLIDTLSEPIREKVLAIRDEAIMKMEDDTFGRQMPLEKIKSIKAKGKDLSQIIKIYRKWYGLPSSSNDLDAFIVKYSKNSHQQIAKRLISSAVASIEHVKPHSRGGGSDLSNLILVSAQFNNSRSSMPLWEYMMLNPQINFGKNLQNYMNEVIKEVHNPKSPFSQRAYYPEKIKKVISDETNSRVLLDTEHLCLTRGQKREMSNLKNLGKVYRIVEK